jgi:hypothetical protein
MNTSDPRPWLPANTCPAWSRLGAAPAELIDHLCLLTQDAGHTTLPCAASPSVDFCRDVAHAVAALPPAVLALLHGSLLGLYTARGLGSSAVSEVVLHQGRSLGVVVVLDLDVLQDCSANRWASWKENLPFQLPADSRLRVSLARAGQDNRQHALQFLLLHECGHVLTAGRQFLPDWWLMPQDLGHTHHYPFLALSWRIDAQQDIVPDARHDFTGRDGLAFYGGAKLGGDRVIDLYSALRDTRFATLYAARNAYEDFAESFALYVHTVLLGQPYEVALSGPASRLLSNAQMVATRCAAKFSFIEGLLQAPKSAQQASGQR